MTSVRYTVMENISGRKDRTECFENIFYVASGCVFKKYFIIYKNIKFLKKCLTNAHDLQIKNFISSHDFHFTLFHFYHFSYFIF